ncbi:MAG TPA: Ig-like domain-containing protein [Patescibacteria group bacterium]|nr:Ig-like domain-containing protein [Patescibacteria group bacterium]
MDKKFVFLIGVFFVLFGLFISLILFEKPLVRLTRAKLDQPSAEKSIIFAWPLKVVADSRSESVITVFARNENSDELSNRTITLASSIGQLVESTAVTDKLGKAEFRIRSSTIGLADLKAVIDNTTPVNQTVVIEFISSEKGQ